MELLKHEGGVRAMLANDIPADAVGLAWLGQAGFALKHPHQFMLIDPYLSDSLANKYRGKEFPHVRLMRPPIELGEVRGVDATLCTHRHGDHMDPGTLPIVAANNPDCRFIVPRAESESAANLGLSVEKIVTLDAGETATLAPDIQVSAIPSAHETLKVNERGEHHYLGYIIRLGRLTLYHSGDCVPYDGLAQQLDQQHVDLALLPINGRDEYRRRRGVPGNMTFLEAESLCRDAGIPWLVPQHFDMFDFNTIDRRELAEAIGRKTAGIHVVVPEINIWFELRISP